MGLFDFLKKKETLQEKPSTDFDLSELSTDLPPVMGSELSQDSSQLSSQPQPITQFSPQLPSLDSGLPVLDSNQNMPGNMPIPQGIPQELPPHPVSVESSSKSSMTVNVAPLDFTMPFSDDHDSISDDLNKLFLTDPEWKEPDWSNFEPYYEPEIEHPTSEDFGVTSPNTDLPEFDTLDTDTTRTRSTVPVDVFVKGSDYARVFSELTKITQTLKVIDPKIEQANNTFSKEEILMKDAKDDMEYAYKKLVQIEKKIFNDT